MIEPPRFKIALGGSQGVDRPLRRRPTDHHYFMQSAVRHVS